MLGSALGFLRTRVIAADLNRVGTAPVKREECIISVIFEIREGIQAFMSGVGKRRRWQVVQ